MRSSKSGATAILERPNGGTACDPGRKGCSKSGATSILEQGMVRCAVDQLVLTSVSQPASLPVGATKAERAAEAERPAAPNQEQLQFWSNPMASAARPRQKEQQR